MLINIGNIIVINNKENFEVNVRKKMASHTRIDMLERIFLFIRFFIRI